MIINTQNWSYPQLLNNDVPYLMFKTLNSAIHKRQITLGSLMGSLCKTKTATKPFLCLTQDLNILVVDKLLIHHIKIYPI